MRRRNWKKNNLKFKIQPWGENWNVIKGPSFSWNCFCLGTSWTKKLTMLRLQMEHTDWLWSILSVGKKARKELNVTCPIENERRVECAPLPKRWGIGSMCLILERWKRSWMSLRSWGKELNVPCLFVLCNHKFIRALVFGLDENLLTLKLALSTNMNQISPNRARTTKACVLG